MNFINGFHNFHIYRCLYLQFCKVDFLSFQVFSILIEHCNFDLREWEQYILIESEEASHQTLVLIAILLHHLHGVSLTISEQYYLEDSQYTFRIIGTENAKYIKDKACDLISCNSIGHTFSIYYVWFLQESIQSL